jgi:hypothetical protein
MIRHVAAVAVALCLSSSPVSANHEPQATALTVKTLANVHKSQPPPARRRDAPGGTVPEITRNLGS